MKAGLLIFGIGVCPVEQQLLARNVSTSAAAKAASAYRKTDFNNPNMHTGSSKVVQSPLSHTPVHCY